MTRREFSAKVKVAAFERCGGLCEQCSRKLYTADINYDHEIPDQLGGEPALENCRVLCRACHGTKTAKRDVPTIAKAKRRERAHAGIKRASRPMPGTRASGWKRKLDGSVIRR